MEKSSKIKMKPAQRARMFKSVKGIGWFIKEYNIAQISYNLTDINVSPLHLVFDKTCEQATKKGIRVTGSELIGLVPKKVLIDAGEYFLKNKKIIRYSRVRNYKYCCKKLRP